MRKVSLERLAQQKWARHQLGAVPREEKVSPIDKKLNEIREWNKEGRPLTLTEIADFCGCSRELIRQIEQRALEKLQSLLCVKELELFASSNQTTGFSKHKQKPHQ